MTRCSTLRAVLNAAILIMLTVSTGGSEVLPLAVSGFSIKHQLVLPGTPEIIFDAFTGDVSEWWDHSWSESPRALYIEPRAGGGFYEIFDDSGNGALHATVITASRGRLLRMDGPLGLAGDAVTMVHTIEFAASGTDSTTVTLTVNAAGQIKPEVPETVDAVWKHFLTGQFKTYVESGKYLTKVSPSK